MNSSHSEKLGILGGTFDPVHYGHLLIAQSAAEEFGLKKIFFLPTGKSPHKPEGEVTAPEIRCEMVRLAVRTNPRFDMLTLEAENTEINYTYLTLQKIRQMYPNDSLYFIMGEDSLDDFPGWRNPQDICRQASILAAVRNADGTEISAKVEAFRRMYSADMHMLHAPNFSVSSREIRERIRHGKSIRYMLPREVADYIYRYSVYGRREEGEQEWTNS